MATRSTIWIKKENNYYDGIYCHWDGYLSYNGLILSLFYNNINRVKELISNGDLSSLNKCIKPEEINKSLDNHTFKNPIDNVCVFYHRDKKEKLNIFKNKHKIEIKKHFQQYNYIFENDIWYLSKKFLSSRLLENLEHEPENYKHILNDIKYENYKLVYPNKTHVILTVYSPTLIKLYEEDVKLWKTKGE